MDRIAIIRDEAARFADVLSATNPEARCPTCPDWSAADLLWHLTEAHFFWAGVLERNARTESEIYRSSSRPSRPARWRPAAARVACAGTYALPDQLGRLDDDEPRWSWWPPDQTVGFTRRMQTYEATIHRVDADLTAGRPIVRDRS